MEKRVYRAARDICTKESFDTVRRAGGTVLFHMRGCGWCQRMMPEWDAAAREVATMWKVERSVGPAYRVDSYPTIVRFTDGREYDGERDRAGFVRFARGL